MSDYRIKPGKIGEKVINTYKKVEDKFTDAFLENDSEGGYTLKTGKMAEKVVGGYKAVENTVVGGYKSIENTFVNAYKKVEDKFVDAFLEKVEDEPAAGTDGEEFEASPAEYPAPDGNLHSPEDSVNRTLEFSREISEKYTKK